MNFVFRNVRGDEHESAQNEWFLCVRYVQHTHTYIPVEKCVANARTEIPTLLISVRHTVYIRRIFRFN